MMIPFALIPSEMKILILLIFFLISIFACAILITIQGQRTNMKIRYVMMAILLVILIICLGFFSGYGVTFGGKFHLAKAALFWRSYPVWMILLVMISMIATEITFYWQTRMWKKLYVSSMSLKEAVDHLPDGICFAQETGFPYLVNHRMNLLSMKLLGRPVLNAKNLWEKVKEQQIHCEEEDSSYIIALGNAFWRFRRELVENSRNIYQISAQDITEIWRASDAIRRENALLNRMNDRLRDYQLNLEAVIKEDELLAIRVRVHDDLGRILLSSRRYLHVQRDDVEENDYTEAAFRELMKEWHVCLAMLRREESIPKDQETEKELARACEFLGMKLKLVGDLPKDPAALHLLVSGARETMTNASHAEATEFCIEVVDTKAYYLIEYRNNGMEPAYPVTEGGGLTSLRRMCAKERAEVTVASAAPFYVGIRIPKIKNEE